VSREEWRQILSQRDWRKILPYTPIAAIIAVIVIALGMDLAFGAPSKPKVNNAAPPPEVIRATIAALPVSPTPYVPPSTATPTAAPTPDTGPTAQARDQTRIRDMAKIANALVKYEEEKGEFPSTGGNVQTLCVYRENDAGCKISDVLDPIPGDPLGESVKNGYWYASDGKTFTIIAGMDSSSNATPGRCDPKWSQHTRKANLACLTGP